MEVIADTIDPEHNVSATNVYDFCTLNYNRIKSIIQRYDFDFPSSDFSKQIAFISKVSEGKVCDVLYYVVLRNHVYNTSRSFEKYSEDQPLFKLYPELLVDTEYIFGNVVNDLNNIKQYYTDGHKFWGIPYKGSILCLVDDSELYSCVMLSDASETKIHVDPYRFYNQRLHEFFTKGITRWVDPHWKSRKQLRKGQTGSVFEPSYYVEDLLVDEVYCYFIEKIWDVGSIRLEVSIKNNDKNGFIILVEELKYLFTDAILVGRCIHLDISEGEIDSNSIMNHIDFAINYYLGESENERLGVNISTGGDVVEASFRSHVIRLNEVRFEQFPKLCVSFINNKRLAMEFIYDLLGIKPSQLCM